MAREAKLEGAKYAQEPHELRGQVARYQPLNSRITVLQPTQAPGTGTGTLRGVLGAQRRCEAGIILGDYYALPTVFEVSAFFLQRRTTYG